MIVSTEHLPPVEAAQIWKHHGQYIVARPWPQHTLWSKELVLEGVRDVLTPDEGGITVIVANGSARYRWINISDVWFEGVLEQSTFVPMDVEPCEMCE